MVRPSEQLKRVVAAGPYTWDALDKLEPIIEEAVQQLRDLASDPGFTGEAATAVSDYAEALRSDYLKVLAGIDAARYTLERANVAWATAVRKYSTFDDADTGLLATLSTGGLNIVFDALDDLFDGEDDDDRGVDGLEQLRRELDEVPKKPFPNPQDFETGGAPPGPPPDMAWTAPNVPPPDLDGGDVELDPYSGGNPNLGGGVAFDGPGSGLAVDGPGAGIAGGGGGGGAGGMSGVGSGVGSGAQLGGVGMLGAGIGAGAGAAGAAAAGLAAKGGMMGGGGGMGGGGATQEKAKRGASGLRAPELEEDDDAAPRSEGAGAGGRDRLPDEEDQG